MNESNNLEDIALRIRGELVKITNKLIAAKGHGAKSALVLMLTGD